MPAGWRLRKGKTVLTLESVGDFDVIVAAGPTACGKSALALELAQKFGGEIINADSMQIYAGTPVLSAAPSAEDKALVPHHLYEIYPPAQKGTVVDWLNLAAAVIRDVWKRGRVPIVAGGTGFYIDNLINGTTPIPEATTEVRRQVAAMPDIYAFLCKHDERAAAMLRQNDTTRVRRAAEIFLQTGESIAEWFKRPLIRKLPEAKFRVIKFVPPVQELDERCLRRFDQMMQNGALDEVRQLVKMNLAADLPAMKMLGVPELGAFVRGQIPLAEAVRLAKLHTRQYAKRQRTWFRNKLPAEVTLDSCYETMQFDC